jgi:hypothetical protein
MLFLAYRDHPSGRGRSWLVTLSSIHAQCFAVPRSIHLLCATVDSFTVYRGQFIYCVLIYCVPWFHITAVHHEVLSTNRRHCHDADSVKT